MMNKEIIKMTFQEQFQIEIDILQRKMTKTNMEDRSITIEKLKI